MRSQRPRRRTSSWFGASIVALTLVLSSSGYVSGGANRSAAAAAIPSATPSTPLPNTGASLPWSTAPWPAGASANTAAGIAVSQQGAGEWACVPTTGGAISIWTAPSPVSDVASGQASIAAAEWQQTATLSPSTPEPVGSCRALLDENDLHALVVVLQWGSGEAGTLRSMSYFSADGVIWQPLPGDLSMMALASGNGKRYALLLDTAAPANSQTPELVVSSDDLHTWRVIRPQGLAASDSFVAFWLNPAGTVLLAASYDNTLWMTRDDGASWTRLSTPAMQTSLAAWLSATNQWQLCGWTGTQTQRTECSVDLGKTWKAAPSFTTTTSCGACGNGGTPVSSTTPCDPNAIQPDGSLVAVCLASGTAATAQRDVYLLPPGASAWETVGSAPGGFLALTDGGQLWCIDPAGRIAETQLPA